MEYRLTSKWQLSHHDKDGKDRNYVLFFLNDVLILKQKIPFDTNFERGFDMRTSIYDVYILNGKIHQKRQKNDSAIREVSFPLSKSLIAQFAIPRDLRIHK